MGKPRLPRLTFLLATWLEPTAMTALHGDAQANDLDGKGGRDYLLGYEGDDVLHFHVDKIETRHVSAVNYSTKGLQTYGQKVLFQGKGITYDAFDGGAGFDTLVMTAGHDVLALNYHVPNPLDSTPTDRDWTDRLYNIELIQAGAGDDVVDLAAEFVKYGDVIIEGESGDDVLWASIGNDKLFGGPGNDHLDGGEGDDSLVGGTEDDILVGGRGDDTMTGGDGVDTFIIDRDEQNPSEPVPSQKDIITDFDVNFAIDTGEKIVLLDFPPEITEFGALMANSTEETHTKGGTTQTDVVIHLGGGQTLTLERVTKASLRPEHFIRSLAGSGSLTLGSFGIGSNVKSVTVKNAIGVDLSDNDDGTVDYKLKKGVPSGKIQLQIRHKNGRIDTTQVKVTPVIGRALSGTKDDNVFYGSALSAGLDTVDGGEGIDTLDYSATKEGFTASFLHGKIYFGNTTPFFEKSERFDTFRNIENITGNNGKNHIQGDHRANILIGLGDADYLKGNGGDDWLDGGEGPDILNRWARQ